jgi:hypoxanthine phosphoribosyltransferase
MQNIGKQIVTVHGETFHLMISQDEIEVKVELLGDQISKDYAGKKPLFLGILNGSYMFAADLSRAITIDCEISFVKLSSYKGKGSTGDVQTVLGLDIELTGRHIIIVEDIIDTGTTLSRFLGALEKENPASIALCCCFFKPEALKYPLSIDYCGFEIENRFIIGYGLDYDGLGRNLPSIYQIVD